VAVGVARPLNLETGEAHWGSGMGEVVARGPPDGPLLWADPRAQ
jgi:hypothetical protein